MSVKIYSRFSPPPKKGVEFSGVSLTQQEFADDCDINNMIRRALSGDQTVIRHPSFCNVIGMPDDAHDVANRVANANTVWHDLPDTLKATFGSPEKLLSYIDEKFMEANKPVDHSVSKPVENSTDKPSSVSPETVSAQPETPTQKTT